jgi:asparagine synthase (glutamine-hydrolysing)
MVQTMKHESFYTTGTWSDESLGVYAGWVAREDCFDAVMPLRNGRGDVTLIFSGEDFSAQHTQTSHGAPAARGESGDAGYLVERFEHCPNFPATLNGRFHGLVSDRSRRTVMLFNDRFGMHRLYYHESEDAFYFAAEAKAILKVRPELKRLDSRSLADMVVWRCVPENRSIFQGIRTLSPGSAWIFRNGKLASKTSYFHPSEWEEQEPLQAENYYSELRDTFSGILPRYFAGNAPIGMSLTGGLDTRMIMAWKPEDRKPLPCYTFGGMFRDCQDVIVARQVSDICREPHQVIHVSEEFLSNFPRYAERSVFLTDGYAPVDLAPDLYVQERIRPIAPIRLTGNYGSEVLRGLGAFKPAGFSSQLFDREFFAHLENSRRSFGAGTKHPVSAVVFQETRMRGVDTLEHSQVAVRSPFLDNDLLRVAFRDPKMHFVSNDIFADHEVCNRLIADGKPALRGLRTDRGLAGRPGWFNLLRKWVLEFTFRAEYAYDYGMPQWIARIDHLFSLFHFERLFLGRHKFCHFRLWYRDALSNYVREVLLDRRTLLRPYLQKQAVEKMVKDHLRGTANYTVEIHQLLTLELTHRLIVES